MSHTCPQCKTASETKGRCAGCTALANRVSRINANKSADYKTAFDQMFEADGTMTKEDLCKEASCLYGENLRKFIDRNVLQTARRAFEVTFSGTGEFMDLEDLRKKIRGQARSA